MNNLFYYLICIWTAPGMCRVSMDIFDVPFDQQVAEDHRDLYYPGCLKMQLVSLSKEEFDTITDQYPEGQDCSDIYNQEFAPRYVQDKMKGKCQRFFFNHADRLVQERMDQYQFGMNKEDK